VTAYTEKIYTCNNQRWVLGDANDAVVSPPHPFESFAFSFCSAKLNF